MPKVYWGESLVGQATPGGVNTSYMSIRRANVDGTGAEDVVRVEGAGASRVAAVGVHRGRVYWLEHGGDGSRIQRASLGGTGVEVVVGSSFWDFALHGDHVYWTLSDGPTSGVMRRASLDGTGVEDVMSGFIFDVAFGVDKMCWSEIVPADGSAEIKIRCGNLDGTGAVDVSSVALEGVTQAGGVAVYGGKVYWVARGRESTSIRRADLGGGDAETLVESATTTASSQLPFEVAVHASGLYWIERHGTSGLSSSVSGRLMRADLDGRNSVRVLEVGDGQVNVAGFAVSD